MQPNWFSYLVSKQVMEANIRQKKIVSLGDLTKMLKLKFSTFSEMKKLVKLKNKKGLTDVVKFRSSIKMSVSQQMRDLKTLTKFCTGTDGLRPEREVLMALQGVVFSSCRL